jgi:hypothetical protein
MKIEFNEFFQLHVDVTPVRGDLYRLCTERVYLDGMVCTSRNELFLTKDQLGDLAEFLRKEHDAIK